MQDTLTITFTLADDVVESPSSGRQALYLPQRRVAIQPLLLDQPLTKAALDQAVERLNRDAVASFRAQLDADPDLTPGQRARHLALVTARAHKQTCEVLLVSLRAALLEIAFTDHGEVQ